jgi:GNAT superfamily N-acetyltransferase
MCGLYSLEKNSTENLWLGWFGILPKYRSTGIGGIALEKMTEVARVLGCKALHSYVDESGKPLKFYYRHGFEKLCSVREFLEKTKADPSDFEGMDDHVIRKILV